MVLSIQFVVLCIVGWLWQPAAAAALVGQPTAVEVGQSTAAAVAQPIGTERPGSGVVCAHHFKPHESYYTHSEEDGAPLGYIEADGRHMRCHSASSLCFSIWSDVEAENDSIQRTFIAQGCMNIAQSEKVCSQPECITHDKVMQVKNARFCCCTGHLCNANVSYVPLPAVPDTIDVDADEQEHDPVLLVTIVAVLLVCGVALVSAIVCFCWYRRPLPPPPTATEPAPFTPTVDLAELKLTEIIGRGRYGSVRKGLLFGEDVAVKIFPAWYRHYFMSERDIYTLPWMEHPSLAHFYGADERMTDGGVEYLMVLSHVPQGTVHDYLRTHTLQFGQMCRMAATAVSGLAHLHTPVERRGLRKPAVAHRDVNSRNILVRADGSCCLCDLGFAMKISGGRYFSNGEEQNAETTSLTDVGTLRYMAPEVLEGAVNLRDCETALKQVDMYAMALVLWEMASRCSDLYQGLDVPDYRLPFEAEIGAHPTFDQMQVLVARNRARPLFPDVWKETNPALRQLRETIEDSWDQDGEARLTALCMLERVTELPLLWERYKGNLGLNGALPTLNLVSQLSEPEKIKSDVNVTNADAHDVEMSEMTAETLLTLSPDQEMNLRNSQMSAPQYASSQIQPHQGRNPCIERNLASDQSSQYQVRGNTLVERSPADSLSPAAPNGVVPPEAQALLLPADVVPLRATPIPIVQNAVHGGCGDGDNEGASAAGGGWLGRLRAAVTGRRHQYAQPVPLQPVLPSKTVNVDAEAADCGAPPDRPRTLPLQGPALL